MPTDPETGWIEPLIVINGTELTFAESMAVRVAVNAFQLTLSDPPFRVGLGAQLAENFEAALSRVERAMRPREPR